MFGGLSNMVEWGRGEVCRTRAGVNPQTPAKPGEIFFEKTGSERGIKKAPRRYASFCVGCTFRFNFGTFRSGGVARFVLRIILMVLER